MDILNTYTAFDGDQQLFQGPLNEIVLKIKGRMGKDENSAILIFSDATGKIMDFNFQGSKKDILKRLEVFISGEKSNDNSVAGPGRPKLGVISREVSLLPRHWEWLATQTGGASAILRSLVEDAKKKSTLGNSVKQAQERTYKFMHAIAGDLNGYEDALRALYKRDGKNFLAKIEDWPRDIRSYATELAKSVFS